MDSLFSSVSEINHNSLSCGPFFKFLFEDNWLILTISFILGVYPHPNPPPKWGRVISSSIFILIQFNLIGSLSFWSLFPFITA